VGFVRICKSKTAANARRFLRDLHRACPIRISRILTERAIEGAIGSSQLASGKEFTDRLFASQARAISGTQEFDLLYTELVIEHRLAPPRHPQTNGMVERFNGRIANVLRTNHFDSALDLEQTMVGHVHLYNMQLTQSAPRSRAPRQAMRDWHKSHPHCSSDHPAIIPDATPSAACSQRA